MTMIRMLPALSFCQHGNIDEMVLRGIVRLLGAANLPFSVLTRVKGHCKGLAKQPSDSLTSSI